MESRSPPENMKNGSRCCRVIIFGAEYVELRGEGNFRGERLQLRMND
jgi:hypothetical protein